MRTFEHERGLNGTSGVRFAIHFLFLAMVMTSLWLPEQANAADISLFGPKRYERTQGKPPLYTDTFTGCSAAGAQAVIRVQNGSSKASSLTSAVVGLNGAAVFGESDFKQQTQWLEKVVPFRPGANTLNVELKSNGQQETPFLVVEILGRGCDVTAPTISAPRPADGALLNIARPVIFAAYADNAGGTGIDVSSVRVTLDGSDITSACTSGSTGVSCTLSGDLAEGVHTVGVAVSDLSNNPVSLGWAFTTDTISPRVSITSPPNGQYFNADSITVTGVIDDPTAHVTVNGISAAISEGVFTATGVPLTGGPNGITATAVDPAGNRAEASVSVTLDTKAPVITVTAPQPGVVVSAPQTTIIGTVDEPLASLTMNGGAVEVSSTLTFSSTLALVAGENSALITATDLAGNSSSTTVVIQRDSTPPRVTITAPVNGLMTNTPLVQVSGTVDDTSATVTVGGGEVTLNSKTFNVGYVLVDGENNIEVKAVDPAGNIGIAGVKVILDAQPPVVTLSAPAAATAGTDASISISATDNRGLTLVDLTADGATLWSVAPEGAISAGQTVSLRLSPALNVGENVTVRARTLDAAGNSGSATAVITIDKAAEGPGFIQGKVLDDSRGLGLEGTQVNVTDSKGQMQSITTSADGTWFFELSSGPAQMETVKDSFTTVRRDVTVRPGQRTSVLDSRLTRIDGTVRLVDATGGVVKSTPFKIQNSSFTIDVTIPANALSAQADVRLTPVSNQGLITPLPLGWSPLAVADLRLLDAATAASIDPHPLAAAATLTLPLPMGLGDAALTALLARYDNTSRSWLAVAEVAIPAKATSAMAPINQSGQYVLVLADPAPVNPPNPAAGQELAAVTLQPSDFSLITTTGRVVPQAAPPSIGLRAAGDLLLTAKADAATQPSLLSGLVVNARVTEWFDLTSGDKLQPNATVQDIVLYRTPCATSIAAGATEPFNPAAGLRTTFPVAPSRDFTIVDLLLGKISIDISPPDSSGGVMVGADGARLLQPDGTALSIPAGALSGSAPVSVATLPEASVSALVGADFRLLRGIDIAITGQSLKSSATLSIPAPAGFDPALPVVVAKKFDVKGGSRLKLVAMGKLSGSIISSEPLIPELSNSTNSINSSGQYLFLQAVTPIGYITGQITDAAAAPFAGIQVSVTGATLSDLIGVDGRYLLALAAGQQSVTALDPARGDAATANVTIAANTKTTLNLTVRMVPPQVASVSPVNGAINVQPAVPVVVTFSKPMDKNSINSSTLRLTNSTNSTGTDVPGVLSFNVDNTVVSFYPSDAFKQETAYSVTIAASVKDQQGYPLGQDVVSGFTVRRTIPPVMPPAGAVSGTFPDADGYITVTATQGSAEAGNTVLLINDTSGEIVSVTPQSNGSFTGKVRGQLGDEIKVVLMDYSGNQTTISYLTFKSADGSYLVTAKGGKVEGEDGSLLEIPEGALVGPTVIKVTAVQESNLPTPLQTPGKYLGAFNIDTGGIGFQKEVHLSIPVPVGHKPETAVFVTKPGEVFNADGTVEKVYEIIDSTKIVNNRITTASPPFDGIMGIGSFVFTAFPEVQLGIVSGYAYQDMNDLPGYQEAPSRDAWDELLAGTNPVDRKFRYDRPVQGAVVRTPAAWNYVSYAKSNGFYAGFTTLFANVSAGDLEYKLTAIHPQTMRRETVTGYLTADGTMSRNIERVNFKLADKDTIIPDKTAPAIDFGLLLASGQGPSAKLVSGTVTVGSDVNVLVSVIDQLMGTTNLTVEYTTPDMTTAVQTAVQLDLSGTLLYTPATPGNPAISRYNYLPTFAGELKGSLATYFRPQLVGIYTLIVEATDQSGNKSTKRIQLRAVAQGEIPAAIDGPPFVLTVAPGDKSADVRIDASVQAVFSELVTNVNETTLKLIDTTAQQPVSASVALAVDGGIVKAILTPRANLVYGHAYKVLISAAITDATPNSSANGQLLPLYREIATTFTTTTPRAYDLVDAQFSGGRDVVLYSDVDNNRLYSYVTAADQGWRVIDVTNADNPVVVWPRQDLGIPSADFRFPFGFIYRGVAVEQQEKRLGMTENITFADGNQYGYIRFYDLSDPKIPLLVGREKLSEAYSGIPGRLAMRGDYAYVSTVGAGLQVVNAKAAIANQTAGNASDGSAIVGTYDTVGQGYGHPNDIALSGASTVILTTNNGYLLNLDVTMPELPLLLSSFRPDGYWFSRVAMADDYVFTSAEGATGVMNLAVVGGRKNVGGGQEGRIFTLDLSDPGRPRHLATVKDKDGIEVNASVMDVTVNKAVGLAFVSAFVTSGGSAVNAIQIIDVKDPYNPRLISTITQLSDMSVTVSPGGTQPMIPIGSTMALTEQNGWLYLANQPKGVRTIQLTNGPAVPSRCDDCYQTR